MSFKLVNKRMSETELVFFAVVLRQGGMRPLRTLGLYHNKPDLSVPIPDKYCGTRVDFKSKGRSRKYRFIARSLVA